MMEKKQNVLTLVLAVLCCLVVGAASPADAQMMAVVDTLADDQFSHPWDDPNTPEDESSDGHCEDELHRCTARAAIQEAWNMNNHKGVPLDLTINLAGTLTVTGGALGSLPNGSHLHGNLQTTISGGGTGIGINHNTTVRGLKFAGGLIAIVIAGDGNTISGNIFTGQTFSIFLDGLQNVVGGSTPADRNVFMQSSTGVFLESDNNVVIGNYIGINAEGNVAGNDFGIQVYGDNNTIGGLDPGMKNVISGNTVSGITVSATNISGIGTTIIGNYIGTDPTGIESRPNQYGIQVSIGRALIGGILPAERNIISGNTSAGIETRGDALAVRIIGNDIGSDAFGMPLGNRDGIDLSPGSFDAVIEGNRISHNSMWGIYALGTAQDPSWNHRIRGNTIDSNGFAGIGLFGKATDVVIGSPLTQDFDANEIRNNRAFGMVLHSWSGENPRANTIRKNNFRNNNDYGIISEPHFSPVQDSILPPTIQNYTELGGGNASVTATHDRVGAVIDVYVGEINDSLRYEGYHWLGSGTVSQSNVPVTFTVSSCNCAHVVATATDLAENTSEFSSGFAITTDVPPEHDILPKLFSLENAYPNPFNPTTLISYDLPRSTHVMLVVYNPLGQEVAVLVNATQDAGHYRVEWNAKDVPTGVYFYRLQAGSFSQVGKMLLLK